MGREIRRVPANWQHPKNEEGHYKSLSQNNCTLEESIAEFQKELKEWYEDYRKWESGEGYTMYDVVVNKTTYPDYSSWSTPPTPPDPTMLMPTGEWYQLFEDVSEGSPLSPAFATEEELIEWLANNRDFWNHQWSREGAEHIVKQGFALSGIAVNGKLYKPEDQYLINKDK